MWSFRKEIHKISNITIIPNPPCDLGMDVAFLVDYTGSMGPVIEEVKSSIANIANTIELQSNPNSYRLSLVISDEIYKGDSVTYNTSSGYTSLPAIQKNVVTSGPSTNQYNTAMELFGVLDNEISFTAALNTINTGGFPLGSGAGGPEPLDIALDLVLNSNFVNSFRINVAKYILIFTDNLPGGNDDNFSAADQVKINLLTQNCIDNFVKVVVLGQGASHAVWQGIATATGGSWNLTYDGTVISTQIVAGCEDLDPPIASAGPDQSISSATTSITLDGSNSFDLDGTVVSYLWEQISGATVTINNINSAVTSVTGLQGGDYVFRLTVTDNDGLTDTDFIAISVNQPPIADANIDQNITTLTTTLDGSNSTDSDGSIVSYTWTLISGSGATITTPNNATTTVTGLVLGNTYEFQLTVTDNDGDSDTDTVIINVIDTSAFIAAKLFPGEPCNSNSNSPSIVIVQSANLQNGDVIFDSNTGLAWNGGGVNHLFVEQPTSTQKTVDISTTGVASNVVTCP